jgi:formylglycine-generating enzyme required for sulfatase activity
MGTIAGGSQIMITGAYLALTTGVTIGGTPCTGVTVVNATTVTAMTPAGTLGNADVVITGGKGTITVVGGYRYVSIVVPTWATLVEADPNPAVVTDATLRAAITASGLAWRVRDTATQMEMLLVPAGTFTMGCTPSNQNGCSPNENPTHSVTLTQSFYMGRYEVTQSQWVARMGNNPSAFQGASYPDAANRPVESVSWVQIPGYLTATGMRLPSEAEWEYACRAGTTTAFNNGSSDESTAGMIAWWGNNSGGETHAVGGKAANALGLYDMSGNVWEYANDRYESTYYSVSPSTNPPGPASGSSRVLRGGSFRAYSPYEVRSSYRAGGGGPPDQSLFTSKTIGFRVARDVVLALSVSSVSPTSGSTLGGTAITITGVNLIGASSVTVGGVAATSVVTFSPTSITAVTPAGAAGTTSVAVTTADGTATLTNGFTYGLPASWATVIEQYVDAAVVTNVAMRNAITASGLPWRVRDTATQMEMLLVPAGTFTMGCTPSNQNGCSPNENPTHSVTLTQSFYMGRYEVTQSQWVARMGTNPSYFQGNGYPGAANRPVDSVSWTTIQGYLTATGMRLPSEAEWEYACRAGTTTAFNNGSSDDATVGTIAWYGTNSSDQTHAVGGKAANALGLYDMAGNVWEWVNDWYYDGSYYSVSPSTNPPGPVSGSARVLRGGSWRFDAYTVRSSYRAASGPDSPNFIYGFRAARAP